jgi:hypothetical protein
LELLEEILEFLAREDLLFEWTRMNVPFSVPFELKSEDFMAFAKVDLEENTERSMVNALSNIKRAVDCRILSLLLLFGVYNKAKKENWNFPQSADFLSKIGVLAPNILKKINRKRNELEHDFKRPTCEEVIDYFDVASLFLSSTNQFLQRTYTDYGICPEDYENEDAFLSIKLNYEKELIELEFFKEKHNKELKIPVDDEDSYIRILSHLVKHLLNP